MKKLSADTTSVSVDRRGEDGFTIIESALALGLIFAILVGLLHTMVVSSRGIVTARQRNIAVGLANQVLETARGNNYDQVGLSAPDATIAADTKPNPGALIDNASGVLKYEGDPLAYATGVSLWPAHTTSQVIGGARYTTKVYVTTVTPASGDAYKRVTAVVSWANPQYRPAAIVPEIKLSTYIFNAQLPADPQLQGLATASGGFLTVTANGSLASFIDNYTITDATFTMPRASADLNSELVKSASGLAQSANVSLRGSHEAYASGAAATSGTEASAPGAKTSSTADNDAGTPSPSESQGSAADAGGSIGRINNLDMIKGASAALSSQSTVTAGSLNNPVNDTLPYTFSRSAGPVSFTMPMKVAGILGSASIGNIIATGTTDATASADRADAGADRMITSSARVAHPATTLFTFSGTGLSVVTANGLPYSGFVKIGETGYVTATASAGHATAAPTVTGGSFEVCMFDTQSATPAASTCPAGYKRLVVAPGSAGSATSHADLSLNGKPVALDATVTSVGKDVRSTLTGNTYQRAEAALVNWFKVTVDMTIASDARLHVELDYGQVSARTKFCLPTDAACITAAL